MIRSPDEEVTVSRSQEEKRRETGLPVSQTVDWLLKITMLQCGLLHATV